MSVVVLDDDGCLPSLSLSHSLLAPLVFSPFRTMKFSARMRLMAPRAYL